MKNKIIVLLLLLIMSVSITGCENSKTKTLKCSTTESKDGRSTTSDLEVKVKNDEVKDMTLVLNIVLLENNPTYQQAMIAQLRQKTNLQTLICFILHKYILEVPILVLTRYKKHL